MIAYEALALLVLLLISWVWVFDGGIPKLEGVKPDAKLPGLIQKGLSSEGTLWVTANLAPLGYKSEFDGVFLESAMRTCNIDRSCSGYMKLNVTNVGNETWQPGDLRVAHHEYLEMHDKRCRENGTVINNDAIRPGQSVQEPVKVKFTEKKLADNFVFFQICSSRHYKVRLLDSPTAEFKIQVAHGRCFTGALDHSLKCTWNASFRRVSLLGFLISLVVLALSLLSNAVLANILGFLIGVVAVLVQFYGKKGIMQDVIAAAILLMVVASVFILCRDWQRGFLRLFGFKDKNINCIPIAIFGCFFFQRVRLVCNEAAPAFFCTGFPDNASTMASALSYQDQSKQFFQTIISAMFACTSMVIGLELLSAYPRSNSSNSNPKADFCTLETKFSEWVRPLAYLRCIQLAVFVSVYPKTCGQDAADFSSMLQLILTFWASILHPIFSRLLGHYSLMFGKLAVLLILCYLSGLPFWLWRMMKGRRLEQSIFGDILRLPQKWEEEESEKGEHTPGGCAQWSVAEWTFQQASWIMSTCCLSTQDLPRLDQPFRLLFFFAWWSEWSMPILFGFSYFVAMSGLKDRYLGIVDRLKKGEKQLKTKEELERFVEDQQGLKKDTTKRSLEFQNVWMYLALLLVSSLVFDALRLFGMIFSSLNETASFSQSTRNIMLFGLWSSRLAFIFALYFRSTRPATEYTNLAMKLRKTGWEFYARVRVKTQSAETQSAEAPVPLSPEDARFLAKYLENVSLKVKHFKQSGGIDMDNKFQQNIIRILCVTFLTKLATELKDFERVWVHILGV